MSIPYHLDSTQVPYNYLDQDIITDVTSIISQFRTQVVTGLSWTEPSTALFKTPVDAAGRFLDVLLTRIAADTLEIRLRDQAAFTIYTRRIQIDTSPGTYIRYFCNKFGCVVEALRSTSEVFQAHVLDMTPDLTTDHALYVIGNAYRSGASAVDAIGSNSGQHFAKDNGAAAMLSRIRRYDIDVGTGVNTNIIDVTGAIPVKDAWAAIQFGATNRFAGRICHAVVFDSSVAFGTVLRPNIDDATQASFKCIGLATAGSQQRIGFRSA